jgi:hypothetical protein
MINSFFPISEIAEVLGGQKKGILSILTKSPVG